MYTPREIRRELIARAQQRPMHYIRRWCTVCTYMYISVVYNIVVVASRDLSARESVKINAQLPGIGGAAPARVNKHFLAALIMHIPLLVRHGVK